MSPLDEIQVDTVPNPEPLGLSPESRYNYFLILCDRFSRTFRLIGIQDKSTDACIDGKNSSHQDSQTGLEKLEEYLI